MLCCVIPRRSICFVLSRSNKNKFRQQWPRPRSSRFATSERNEFSIVIKIVTLRANVDSLLLNPMPYGTCWESFTASQVKHVRQHCTVIMHDNLSAIRCTMLPCSRPVCCTAAAWCAACLRIWNLINYIRAFNLCRDSASNTFNHSYGIRISKVFR